MKADRLIAATPYRQGRQQPLWQVAAEPVQTNHHVVAIGAAPCSG